MIKNLPNHHTLRMDSPPAQLAKSVDTSRADDNADNTDSTNSTNSPTDPAPSPVKNFLSKVCVLGDVCVGKTAFLRRLVHGIFSYGYKATIGIDFALKVRSTDTECWRLQLWDIAGQERFGNMTRVYYKETAGVFILADATRPSTLEGALKWKNDFVSKMTDDSVPIILLISKSDLDTKVDFFADGSHTNMDDFCTKNGFHAHFIISSKDNIGLEESHDKMIELLRNRKESEPESDSESDSESDQDITIKPVVEPMTTESDTSKYPLDKFLYHDVLKEIFTPDLMNDLQNAIVASVAENMVVRKIHLNLINVLLHPTTQSAVDKIKSNEKFVSLLTDIEYILSTEENDSIKLRKILSKVSKYGLTFNF